MSDAQKIRIKLGQELSKRVPDDDIVYSLKKALPYANTVDIERIRRGDAKQSTNGLAEAVQRLMR